MPDTCESSAPQHVVPFISEENNLKSLHFSKNLLQSSMDSHQPDALALDYTRTMMGFLILHPQPRHIVMIGLGGGSLAKYCYRHLPATKITVVEINPHVIALRQAFQVPEDDERFTVVEANGADFLDDADAEMDVLLVDGYDERGQPPQLCSQSFYENCYRALTGPGILVVNLHDSNPLYELFIGRLDLSFDSNIAEVAANRDGNVIVFAGKKIKISPHSLRSALPIANSTVNDKEALNA